MKPFAKHLTRTKPMWLYIENGKVKLEIDDSFMDEISEIGKYTFQIDLYDNATNKGRVTIPPVIEQFCVLAPIFEDNEATE